MSIHQAKFRLRESIAQPLGLPVSSVGRFANVQGNGLPEAIPIPRISQCGALLSLTTYPRDNVILTAVYRLTEGLD